MEGFLIQGWDLIILSGCYGTSTLAPVAALAARWLYEPQSISDQPMMVEIPHRAWRYRSGGSSLFSPGCLSCRCMESLLTRGWDLPGCGGTVTLARGATLAARSPYL